VGCSKDNWTSTRRRDGFAGERVSRARCVSRGSNGAGGAMKMTFSVLARTRVDRMARDTRDKSSRRILCGVETVSWAWWWAFSAVVVEG
jgi:hypothetical protein